MKLFFYIKKRTVHHFFSLEPYFLFSREFLFMPIYVCIITVLLEDNFFSVSSFFMNSRETYFTSGSILSFGLWWNLRSLFSLCRETIHSKTMEHIFCGLDNANALYRYFRKNLYLSDLFVKMKSRMHIFHWVYCVLILFCVSLFYFWIFIPLS